MNGHDVDVELADMDRSQSPPQQLLDEASASTVEFFRQLWLLLRHFFLATPAIIGCGFCHFALGRENVQISRLMLKIGEFSASYPRFMWFNWFIFFANDWAFVILFTTTDLANLEWAGTPALLAISWTSIAVSTVVLCIRFFWLRPMMRSIGFSYDAPEAREEKNQIIAKQALELDRKLGYATTFAEDFPQAALTLTAAFKSDDGVTLTMGFSLVTSVSASAYVVYDLVNKTLWNPEVDALIALFDATGGTTTWKTTTNWKSHKPLSDWHGIEMDGTGRVVKVDLRRNGLSGERC